MVFCNFPYFFDVRSPGPSSSFFCISPCYLSLSFPREALLYRLEVVWNGNGLCPLGGRLTSLPVTLGMSSASKSLLLLHISVPLPVHLIRMLSALNGDSIADGFRIGCLSSQSWMLCEYVFVIWWFRSNGVRSKVIGIGLSSTSVCVIDISKYTRSSLIRSLYIMSYIGAPLFYHDF